MKPNVTLAVILVFSLIMITGCSSNQGTGALVLKITDAPPELNIEKAQVTISNVEVHLADESEEENVTTEADWFPVVETPQTFDLIEIKDVKAFLGEAQLQAGKYTQVRLHVDEALVTIDGIEYTLEIPSGTVKLIKRFTIVDNATTTLVLDFDAQQSIHANGADRYIMRPTIKILQE